MKKLLKAAMAVVLATGLMPSAALARQAEPERLAAAPGVQNVTNASGIWGTCYWSFDEGELTVYSGVADATDETEKPWEELGDDVVAIEFAADEGGKAQLPQDCSGLMAGLRNLKSVSMRGADLNDVTDMSMMFADCPQLETIDLTGVRAYDVTDTSKMFYGCKSLAQVDLSGIGMGNVESMLGMFYGCSALGNVPLAKEGFESTVSLQDMFRDCTSLETVDFEGYDFRQAQDMDYMFAGCTALASANLKSVEFGETNLERMFSGCTSLAMVDLTGAAATSVTTTSRMFEGCTALGKIGLGREFRFKSAATLPDSEQWWNGPNGLSMCATDLEARYDGDTMAGTWTIGATPQPKQPTSIGNAEVTGVKDRSYTGNRNVPVPTVKLDGKTLKADADYTLAYMKATGTAQISTEDVKDAGNYRIAITGIGDYTGTKTVTFKIAPIAVSTLTVAGLTGKTYTGTAIEQEPVVRFSNVRLAKGTDYTLTYKDNVNVGTASVTVTGKGNFTGSKTVTYAINPAAISRASVAKIAAKTYRAKAYKLAPAVKYAGKKLKKGTDYVLFYKNNVKAGKATVTVTGKGNYTGTKKVTFTIGKAPAMNFSVAKIAAKKFTGKALKPTPTVKYAGKKLKKGTDYALSYAKNKKRGTATVTITGKGNFKGTKTVKFKIK